MIHAVIFDMDGLLVDSEPYWEKARREFCLSQECEWSPEDEHSVKGNNSQEWAAAIRGRCALTQESGEIINAVTGIMRRLYDEHLPLLPGAVDVVRELSARYPLAIASSSPTSLIEFATAEAGVRDSFVAAVSADTVARGKPAPDVFLAAARALHAEARACAVFEDSSAGILAGRAAGMAVVAVPNPHYPPSEEALRKADLVLTSLQQFEPEMLDRLGGERPA